jgi:hypothetical protein
LVLDSLYSKLMTKIHHLSKKVWSN